MWEQLIPAGLAIGGQVLGAAANATKKSPKLQQLPRLAPNQIAGQNQGLSQGLQMLANPTQGFEPIRQNALNTFQNNIVPNLAARFGPNSRIGSPAFLQQLGMAGSDLTSQLGSQEAQYAQNQQQLGHNLLQTGLQPQFDYTHTPGGPSFLSSLFGQLGGGLTNYGMSELGNQQQLSQFKEYLPLLMQLLGGQNANQGINPNRQSGQPTIGQQAGGM